jgi:hypothetical protein
MDKPCGRGEGKERGSIFKKLLSSLIKPLENFGKLFSATVILNPGASEPWKLR